ncbi:MAG: N-acetylmuramic acid 6-phosphate etherase [Gemmatimonadetes bacterium]|nr:N-acetylmuramic acid 6-phosphate etherase [Gemmatimonadota bacterium]NIO32051.1 N-acetylmuramic acid 6-phosphate etherase [Gemmatimonadota bacterium]
MADDLFDPRLTEHGNPRTRDIDLADALGIVDLINAEDAGVSGAVLAERERLAEAIEIAVECFKRGGRLIYVGAGTSGRLGVLDATECPPTFGTDPEMVQGIIAGGAAALTRSQEGAEDCVEDGVAAIDEAKVGPDDFVFGIATSSTTPYVRAALARAAERDARTGFLCCTEPGEEMRGLVDVCIVPLVGPEVIAGSTRMKAGTATKLVLNTLTTGAMIRLGKVYGNLMVDLQAWSEKLIDRSARIMMAATGCSREEALPCIDEAGGSLKLAVVMKGAAVNRGMASLYLAESDGFVRRALELARAVDDSDDPYRHYPIAPPDEASMELVRSALLGLLDSLSEIVSDLSDERLRERPEAKKWCVKEQIEHLRVADHFFIGRITAILNEDEPLIADRDDEVENRKISDSGARDAAIGELIGKFAESRTALSGSMEGAATERWSRVGRHEVFGPISIYQLLRHCIWHDHRHLEAIRRLVSD